MLVYISAFKICFTHLNVFNISQTSKPLIKIFRLNWDKIRENNNYIIIQSHYHHLTEKFNLANKFENKNIYQIASQFYITIFKWFIISDLYFFLFINEVFKNNKIKERNKDIVYLYYNIDEYKMVM